MRRIIIIGIALLAILITGAVFVTMHSKNRTASSNLSAYRVAGDTFMDYVTSKDASRSYAMFSSRMKQQYSESQWSEQMTSSLKEVSQAKFSGEGNFKNDGFYEKDASPHQLQYNFTTSGAEWQTSFIVFKQNGAWKVDNMTSRRL